ncbi:hypothetical protein [Pseudoalteromonas lipolytica]|uniref:Uncharacterized protein n=1 Tax=Pseudoalteromonas lipolytica TaxID=570156 RepID=A0ABU8SZ32_9GAMM
MKFKYSKLVIAITCLTSTVSFDYSTYSKSQDIVIDRIPSFLLSGFRWSSNKAFACNDVSECNYYGMPRYEVNYDPTDYDYNYGYGNAADWAGNSGYDQGYDPDGGGSGGGASGTSSENTNPYKFAQNDKEVLADAMTVAVQLKIELNNAIASGKLNQEGLAQAKNLLGKLENYTTKLNVVLSVINSGAQFLNHTLQGEVEKAVAELSGALVAAGVGGTIGGPVGVVGGFFAGMYTENAVEYLLVDGGAEHIINEMSGFFQTPSSVRDGINNMACAYSYRNEACRNRREP